jgi:hypothetical protein
VVALAPPQPTVVVLPPPPLPTSTEALWAKLAGTGTLTAAVTPILPVTAALSGDGALTATVAPALSADAELAATGALTAEAFERYTPAADLAGAGTLSATVVPVVPVAAAFSGSGYLDANAAPTVGVVVVAANFADLLSGSGTVPIPAHQANDLLLMYAFNCSNYSPTPPAAGGTVPGWYPVDTKPGANNCASATYHVIVDGPGYTSGIWQANGALGLIVLVLRGVVAGGIGGHGEAGGVNANDYPSCPGFVVTQADGTSALLQLFGVANSSLTGFTWNQPPAGYTRLIYTSKLTYACYKQVTTNDGAITMTNNLQAALGVGNLGYRGAQLEYLAH